MNGRDANADETPQARSERFNLRATPAEAALVRQAAYARRQSVTEFLLTAGLAEARVAVSENERLEVAAAVYDRLAHELQEEPGEIVDALVDALKQPRRLRLPN
jgi:uncharacterized protein (DUF1778 family)